MQKRDSFEKKAPPPPKKKEEDILVVMGGIGLDMKVSDNTKIKRWSTASQISIMVDNVVS